MITASIDPNPAASIRHIRLTVALLLAALLALLWWTGHGPGAAASCCAASVAPATSPAVLPAPESIEQVKPVEAVVAPPAAVAPAAVVAEAAPAQPVAEPVPAQAVAESSPAEVVTEPAPAEAVAEPAAAAPVNEAAPVEGPAAEAPAEPSYTLTDPNAQVRTDAVTLAPWTGPSWPKPEHFVYYPPAKPVAAEPAPAEPSPVVQASADLPPAAKVFFATSKWDLPPDTGEKLAPIIDYLQSHSNAKAVIQGFHDPRGDAETNQMLARNRAGALWNALTGAGIARDRVILQKPEDTTGTGSLTEARRAEVSVSNE